MAEFSHQYELAATPVPEKNDINVVVGVTRVTTCKNPVIPIKTRVKKEK